MADTDIDRFIRHQKSKLASEKRELNDDEVYPKPARRQWAEPDKENFDVTDIEEPEERPETPAHQGYPVDNRRITKQQKELSVERKKEYNDYLKTHSNNRRKVRNESPTLKSIKMGVEDSGKKERLREERKNEYINNLQSNTSPERLLIGENLDLKQQRDKLRLERQQEYKDMMSQKNGTLRSWREPSKEEILLDDKRQHIRKKLENERNSEYNEHIKKQRGGRNNDLPPKPGTPGGFLNKLGSHENQRKKLQDERQKEYNRLQAEKLGLNMTDDPKMLRGEEPPGTPRKGWGTPTYEEMLDKKRNEEQRYRRLNDPEYSRPGLKAYNSEGALHRLEDEKRLKDIEKDLTKKSILENGILDNPDWLKTGRPDPERAYSHLLGRLKNWDRDSETEDVINKDSSKKPPETTDNELPPRNQVVRIHEYPPRGIKDAPAYIPDENKHRFYATLPVGEKQSNEEIQKKKDAYKKELERQMKEVEESKKRNRIESLEPAPETVEKRPPVQQRVIVVPNNQVLPDVIPPIQQIAQQQYQLTTGGDRLSPRAEMLLGRTKDLERLERRLKKIEQQNAGISAMDISDLDFMPTRDPRTKLYQSGPSATGILEQGFDRLYEPSQLGSVKPPVGLEYQPTTYVTGGDHFDKFSSVDQAYHYYGSRNPLDIPAAPAATTQYGSAPAVAHVAVDNYRGGGGGGGGGYSSPTFAPPARNLGQEDVDIGTESERKNKSKAQAQQYQRELERQMEQKRYKKVIDKEERERYERKLEEDIRNYNPYGRGGGGAPMKDSSGNTVADLRALQKGYSPRHDLYDTSPRGIARPASPKDDLLKAPPAQTTTEGESTYARGGHGIFGHPKTEAEKTQADKYKDELQRQIDKKKHDAQLEKERERQEEERQQKIIDEQQRKMQQEYEEEKRRIQAKEDEARLRNAEIIKLQEDRKTDEERLRGEVEKNKREEARLDYERERLARENARGKSPPVPAARKVTDGNDTESKENNDENKNDENKTNNEKNEKTPASLSPRPSTSFNQSGSQSPPLPAVKTQSQEALVAPSLYEHRRSDSPLLPTLRHRNIDVYSSNEAVKRNNSADVLNQLAHMRRQLQSERKRVENMLEETMNEPEVFDPRLVNRVPVQIQQTQKNDIFETARNRNAVQVRRAGTADQRVLQDFDNLKHKDDTDSRKQFRKLYPSDPRSQEELESQQAAFIRQQEDRLRRYDQTPSINGIPTSSNSPQAMLHSNSAFIDVDGMDRNLFPDDFDDFPKRNDSARQRRRQRDNDTYRSKTPRDVDLPRNYNPMGSVASLDVDKISRKNEDRLRRLKEIQGDDLSLYDPDDVLNRFMEKQSHNSQYDTDIVSRILTPE